MSNKMAIDLSDFLSRYDFETVETNDSDEFKEKEEDVFLQVVCEHPKIEGRLSFNLSKNNFWMSVIQIHDSGLPTLICYACRDMKSAMDGIKKHFNNITF